MNYLYSVLHYNWHCNDSLTVFTVTTTVEQYDSLAVQPLGSFYM